LPSAIKTTVLKSVHKQGYLPVEREVMAPDIGLAGVKVSDRSHVDRVDVFPSQYNARSVWKNEINGRVAGQATSQCLSDVSKHPCLPRFTDTEKQNIVHFLDDLESYFPPGVCRIHLS